MRTSLGTSRHAQGRFIVTSRHALPAADVQRFRHQNNRYGSKNESRELLYSLVRLIFFLARIHYFDC